MPFVQPFAPGNVSLCDTQHATSRALRLPSARDAQACQMLILAADGLTIVESRVQNDSVCIHLSDGKNGNGVKTPVSFAWELTLAA